MSDPDGTDSARGTAARSALFDRVSILVLAISWTVFGSMHFSMREETIAMVPDWWWLADHKPVVVTITGMIEVFIGIMILVRRATWWCAAVSLLLLVLYLPAVYHILAGDKAAVAFRVALLPHNIFLGICSAYLLLNPNASLTGTGPARLGPRLDFSDYGMAVLLVAGLLLMANSAGFLAIAAGVSGHQPTAYLWAMMCIATGALIGFLFAVPRVNPSVTSHSHLVANTNIEQVSDWLTKILVGVGLINFKEIGKFIQDQSDRLATSLSTQSTPIDQPLALSLIVYFFVVGLIQGYLLTRLFLSKQFEPGS